MANELFTIFKVDVEEAEAILRGNFEPHAHVKERNENNTWLLG